MITKKQFIDYLEKFKIYEDSVEKVSEALGNVFLWDCAICDNVGKLLDIFLESHFTEEGCDLITWFLFESVEKTIYEPATLFEPEKEIHLTTLEDLWNYLITNGYLNG